jgi:hypothetical protein
MGFSPTPKMEAWVRTKAARLPDRTIVPGLVAFVIGASFSMTLIVAAHSDVSRLVDAGRDFTDRSLTPSSLTIMSQHGFDGQFYYRLANAPFSDETFVAGVRFDIPSLRAQRLVYPAISWVGSFGGRTAAVPWALLGVNIIAMAIVGALSGALALASGRRALWGLMIVAYPGFVYSLSFDLTEIVATACVLAGLLALRKARYSAAAIALVLAVLSRETTVLVPIGVLLAWMWDRWRNAPIPQRMADARAVTCALIALGAFVLWQGWLWHVWGTVPVTASTEENVRVPLEGLARSLPAFVPSDARSLFRSASALLLVGIGILTTYRWRDSHAPLSERLAFLLAVAVLLMQSEHSWPDAASFLRVGTEYWVLGILTLLGVEARGALWLLPLPTGLIWIATAMGRIGAVSRVA